MCFTHAENVTSLQCVVSLLCLCVAKQQSEQISYVVLYASANYHLACYATFCIGHCFFGKLSSASHFSSQQSKRGTINYLYLQPIASDLIRKCLVCKTHTHITQITLPKTIKVMTQYKVKSEKQHHWKLCSLAKQWQFPWTLVPLCVVAVFGRCVFYSRRRWCNTDASPHMLQSE